MLYFFEFQYQIGLAESKRQCCLPFWELCVKTRLRSVRDDSQSVPNRELATALIFSAVSRVLHNFDMATRIC